MLAHNPGPRGALRALLVSNVAGPMVYNVLIAQLLIVVLSGQGLVSLAALLFVGLVGRARAISLHPRFCVSAVPEQRVT